MVYGIAVRCVFVRFEVGLEFAKGRVIMYYIRVN